MTTESLVGHVADTYTGSGESRPVVLSIAVKERSALRNAYLPQFVNSGLFIPTSKPYSLGQKVFCLLSLPDSEEKIPISALVAWIRLSPSPGGRAQGVGVHFCGDAASAQVVKRIESILGADALSEKTGSAAW